MTLTAGSRVLFQGKPAMVKAISPFGEGAILLLIDGEIVPIWTSQNTVKVIGVQAVMPL